MRLARAAVKQLSWSEEKEQGTRGVTCVPVLGVQAGAHSESQGHAPSLPLGRLRNEAGGGQKATPQVLRWGGTTARLAFAPF